MGEGDGSITVCAVVNQTLTRVVVVRLATVEAAVPNAGLNQAKGLCSILSIPILTCIILVYTFAMFSVYFYLPANRDYTNTTTQLIFRSTAGQQLQCADITIIDDTIFERTEMLLVVLSSLDRGVQLDPQYAFITILDNDGIYCINVACQI